MASTAHVSLYRPSRYWGFMGRFAVFVDDTKVGKIANGKREQYAVSPGTHQISIKPGLRKTDAVSFTVAPGESAAFAIESVSLITQMALSTVYLFTGKNYWLKSEKP